MAEQERGSTLSKDNFGESLPSEKGINIADASVCLSSEEDTKGIKSSGVASVYKSSEEFFEYTCDPCKHFGDCFEAEGFCTHCKEYLCITCFRSHSRNKASKHHTLLEKDNMPRKKPKLCNPCKLAGDEKIAVGYCENCCDFLCNDCYKSHPRNKMSRDHVLVKNERLEETEQVVTSSFVQMNITKGKTSDVNIGAKLTYVRDINVKSDTDKKDCYITRITLVSKNELVLLDKDNQCLKLVDINKNIIKAVLALPSGLCGVTAISNDEIAVVGGIDNEIQIISIHDSMTIDRTIKTTGTCVDVKMLNKHLYVSLWNPTKFQILRPTGAIIKTITPDGDVFKDVTPRYIAVSLDETVIYISDWETNKILSLDMNGRMLALYKGELEYPHDIFISPSGSVYVCSRGQNVVYKMNSDLSEALVILGPGDGMMRPTAICLNTNNQHFYISSGSFEAAYCNNIKVFKY